MAQLPYLYIVHLPLKYIMINLNHLILCLADNQILIKK